MDLKQYIFAAVRMFGTVAVVWLAAKAQISETEATNVIVAVVTVAIGLIWSFVNKWRNGEKVEVALELPAGSSKEKLKKVLEG
jgi:hypothetical protein